jgi:hypothetical protein
LANCMASDMLSWYCLQRASGSRSGWLLIVSYILYGSIFLLSTLFVSPVFKIGVLWWHRHLKGFSHLTLQFITWSFYVQDFVSCMIQNSNWCILPYILLYIQVNGV